MALSVGVRSSEDVEDMEGSWTWVMASFSGVGGTCLFGLVVAVELVCSVGDSCKDMTARSSPFIVGSKCHSI